MFTAAAKRTCAVLAVLMASAAVSSPAMPAQPPTAGSAERAAPACCDGARIAGHEPDVNPALRRFTGIVVDLGAAAADGRHFTLRMGPIGRAARRRLPTR